MAEQIRDLNDTSIPQPEELTKKEKEDAFGVYFLMFAGTMFPFPFIEFLFSLIFYFYHKKRSRFVAFHAYQSLVSQIAIELFIIVMIILMILISLLSSLFKDIKVVSIIIFSTITILGITAVVFSIIYLVISIIAALEGKKGKFHYMPFVGKMAFKKFYGPGAMTLYNVQNPVGKNVPPEGM